MEKTVFIVDDDPSIRELLRVNLEHRGFKVKSAVDGSDALAQLSVSVPDLVILDVIMPKIDGLELCKLLKDDKEFQNTKILMLTAKGQQRDRMIGKEILKADEYITKPFDVEKLIETIEKLLRVE